MVRTPTQNQHPFAPDDDNTYPSFSSWQAMGMDKHSKTAFFGQTFTNTSINDYTLKTGSLACDSGTMLRSCSYDIRGNKRPQGLSSDIGAYEYINSVSLPRITSIIPLRNAVNVSRAPVIKVSFSRTVVYGNSWIELKSTNRTSISLTKN